LAQSNLNFQLWLFTTNKPCRADFRALQERWLLQLSQQRGQWATTVSHIGFIGPRACISATSSGLGEGRCPSCPPACMEWLVTAGRRTEQVAAMAKHILPTTPPRSYTEVVLNFQTLPLIQAKSELCIFHTRLSAGLSVNYHRLCVSSSSLLFFDNCINIYFSEMGCLKLAWNFLSYLLVLFWSHTQEDQENKSAKHPLALTC